MLQMSDDKDKVEVVGLLPNQVSAVPVRPDWQEEVYERTEGKCFGCGSKHKVRAKLIVPVEAGGHPTAENAYLVCRACEMATDANHTKNKTTDNRPINFWVSRRLFQKMDNGLCSDKGFGSKSALIRYLMGKYIQDESRFDDLDQYQDYAGVDSAKVNAWVPKDIYATFQSMVKRRGLSVTDAVVALVMVYEMEAVTRGDKDNE